MKARHMPPQFTTARFRFYGPLNDFVAEERRKATFQHTVKGRPSVKDTLEALGAPHTEVGNILVNGRPQDFGYQLREGDRISVYPNGYNLGKRKARRLRPPLPRNLKFVLDSHLGKLARHLRLLGFDSVYRKTFPDQDIVETGLREQRIILTRDIGLLKNRRVIHAYWLRSPDPQRQLKEVVKRFRLAARIRPLTLCLECNGRIRRIAKYRIVDRLPPQTKLYYHRFYLCQSCQKVYWRGSHYLRLTALLRRAGYQRRKKAC